MDNIKKYQQVIAKLLQDESLIPYANKGLERLFLSDFEHNHFQLLVVGWENDTFVHQVQIHLDIKPTGKIWIQQN